MGTPMTENQVRGLGPALDRFLKRFLFCFAFTQTYEHLRSYCRGLLSDLPRKSVEPIALASGTPVRTLQEFLRDHSWAHPEMIDIGQKYAAGMLPTLFDDGLGTIGIIDETGQPKKGVKTPGVQRQWCGRLGKVENCVVTVHLGVARGRFTALLGGDLFLPESWSLDRPRCREAGIPDEVVYRPKWQIALEQLDRAKANGVHLDWATFDEGYGHSPAFLAGLDDRHQAFVGEVPRTLACWAANGAEAPSASQASGRAECVATAALGGQGVAVRVPRQSTADEVWQAVEMTVWLRHGKGWSARSYRLIVAYNARTEEVKYFVSNAAAEVSLTVLVRVAFTRAPVEHCFAIQKGELGFGHYEGRNYLGLMRHMTICCVLGLFVAERAARAQTENAEVTTEQVCFAMRAVNWLWLRLRRGLGVIAAAAATLEYHQKRNAVARASHKKRFALPSFWIVDISRMCFSPPGFAT
jgi:SRSO17 transposase